MKYKILFSVLAILLVFLLASGMAFAAPVEIRTLEDLMAIDDSAANLSLDYILMNDIDVGSQETDSLSFMPIGTVDDPFIGSFDGGSYTISNITFSDNTLDDVGLFGRAVGQDPVFNNVVLKNIALKDVNITGRQNVGGLLGSGSDVTIECCSIDNSGRNSNISGISEVGGLAGNMRQSTISDSYAACNVIGSGNNVGGLAGLFGMTSHISKSYSTGDVIGSGNNVGGLVGFLEGHGADASRWMVPTVSDSYAAGNVSGTNNVGGLVGYMLFSVAFNSCASGNVTGSGDYVGGFVGSTYLSDVSTSYATGNVIGNDFVGGFAGNIFYISKFSNNYATGNVTGVNAIGGFVGECLSTVTNSYAAGTVTGTSNVGDFVGIIPSDVWSNPSSPISNSFYVEPGVPGLGGNIYYGIPATPAEMKNLSTFTNASWNISLSPTTDSIWYINEGISYPKFCWDYSAVTSYSVTFNADGGTPAPAIQTLNGGSLVTQPADPVKSGSIFVEWQYPNGTVYDFNTPVTSDLNLIAVYTIAPVTYTVIFNSDNGISNQLQTVAGGGLVTKPSDPAKSGYTFVEWQLNGTAYDFSTLVTSDLTLLAVYRVAGAPVIHTVTFNTNGGMGYAPSQNVYSGSLVTKPSDPFSFNGIFVGWQVNGSAYDFSTPVTSNMTLVAVYAPTHTVTFNSNGGMYTPSQKVNNGSLVTQPSNPYNFNGTFVEWQLNGSAYNFSTPVTSNITLVAVYAPIHTVTFNTNGGIGYTPSQKVNDGSLVTKPSNPFNFNGTFVEWQLNGVAYDFSTPVTSNFTLVAVYR